MNKILVNQEELNLTEKDFPVLIHGEEGSGASLYTVTLAVNLFSQGFPIVFLCGYPMAEEEFKKQLAGASYQDKVIFYTKEKVSEFKESVINPINSQRIIFVKNIELFEKDVFDLILLKNKIILSGDLNRCVCKKQILSTKFNTKIFFSSFDNMAFSVLRKYEGFFVSDGLKGATKVKFE
ncbi:MAG: hypothetical protein P4L63_00500 [Candidatus Pacebacteria bacterium]|nr:hypothetical protein [Candidatus Paceibacterota bacterium]